MNNPLQYLWEEHMRAPFPSELAGEEIEGEDVAQLDTFTAGCISSYLGARGRLDSDNARILKECERGLRRVVRSLDGDAREYFGRLLRMAEMSLDVPSR